MSYELLLNAPRRVPTPYPLLRAGSTRDSTQPHYNNHYFKDRLEICLRLSTEEEFAIDNIDGHEYRTPFPHIFFKYPFHHLLYNYCTPRVAIHFSYSLDTLARLRKDGILPEQEIFFLPFELNDEIRHLIRRFTDLLNHILERKSLERLDLTAFELLTECLMFQRYPKRNSDCNTDKLLEIASSLQQSFLDYPDFSELARKYGMSQRTLFRHWSNHFGQSPAQFVQKLKVTEAAKLLRETSMPIAAVAASINLGDASYFTKIFRKHFNMTPGEYRKEQKTRLLLDRINTPPTKPDRIW